MKKGFTFAELMISLVVISVITAILYPTIADLGINENKALFKSAYRSMSIALSEVMNDTRDGIVPVALCTEMAARLNIANQDCANNKFTTSNGMRWYVPNNLACTSNVVSCTPNIIIDVAPSNNKVAATSNLSTSVLLQDGTNRNVTADTDAFKKENTAGAGAAITFESGATGAGINDGKQQDTFVFCLNNRGQIVGMDEAGYYHLRDEDYP